MLLRIGAVYLECQAHHPMTNDSTSPENLFYKGIVAFETGSSKLTTWALSIIGGSILIIIGDSYFRPLCVKERVVYLLFLLGWTLLGLSMYFGFSVSRSAMASEVHLMNIEALKKIHKECNSAFSKQLQLFQWGLLSFGVWLILYLFWWIFGNVPISK
jgi:hypothetical protein